jgi:hypothetical protein
MSNLASVLKDQGKDEPGGKKQINTYEGLANCISFDGAFGAERIEAILVCRRRSQWTSWYIFTSHVQVEMVSERFWIYWVITGP